MSKKEILILVIPLLIVAILYFVLPDQIPRQISFSGEVRYASKEFIFIFGIIPYIVYKRKSRK